MILQMKSLRCVTSNGMKLGISLWKRKRILLKITTCGYSNMFRKNNVNDVVFCYVYDGVTWTRLIAGWEVRVEPRSHVCRFQQRSIGLSSYSKHQHDLRRNVFPTPSLKDFGHSSPPGCNAKRWKSVAAVRK